MSQQVSISTENIGENGAIHEFLFVRFGSRDTRTATFKFMFISPKNTI